MPREQREPVPSICTVHTTMVSKARLLRPMLTMTHNENDNENQRYIARHLHNISPNYWFSYSIFFGLFSLTRKLTNTNALIQHEKTCCERKYFAIHICVSECKSTSPEVICESVAKSSDREKYLPTDAYTFSLLIFFYRLYSTHTAIDSR